MKKLFILLWLLNSIASFSQNSVNFDPGEPIERIRCGIWYDYDSAGNRIKRNYDCKDMTDQQISIGDPVAAEMKAASDGKEIGSLNDPSSNIRVYPNPTSDKFNIKIPKAGTHTHFHIYDAKGGIITSGHIDGELYSGNMGMLASGTYIVVVYYENQAHRFTVIKQ